VAGGVVVTFEDSAVPGRVEIIETAADVTIRLFDERPAAKRRHGKFARHEVFVPLYTPLGMRRVINGHGPANVWLKIAS
jgi:hypothetical protein